MRHIGAPIVVSISIQLFTMFAALPCIAQAADDKSAGAAASKFLKKLDAGIEMGESSLSKNPNTPNTLKYSFENTAFYLGKQNGSRFYCDETRTSITRDGPRKFSTRVHAREYGFVAGWRFSAAPRSSFSVGMGRKAVGIDPFDISGSGTISQAGVFSHPFYFNYAYDLGKATRLGFGFVSENVKLDVNPASFVKTSVYKLCANHDWKKFGVGVSYSKYKADKDNVPQNSLMELRGDYKPVGHVDVFLKAGIYSHGAPTGGGGMFSDLGEQFIFTYLGGGEPSLNSFFTQKRGYYSMGVKFTLK